MEIQKPRASGFTLLELLVAVLITSILLAVAVPSFVDILNRNHMASCVNGFIASLVLTRSEAVKREEWVTACPSSDGLNCVSDYTKWGEGYIVFVNSDRDNTMDDGEQLIAVFQDRMEDVVVQSSSNHRNVITYRPNGRAWSFNTTIRFCMPEDPENNRAVIIAPNGKFRLSKRMPGGGPILCDGVG